MVGKNRLGHRTAVLGAATVIAVSMTATAAYGHVPGVGFGLQPTTNGPDLRTVTVIPSSLTDTLPEQARYCFDQPISAVGGAGAYALQTYDSRRAMAPTAVGPDTGNGQCAIAGFAAGTDITQATVGEVVPGAASDLQSRTNIIASEPVSGSVHTKFPGATTGPDIRDVILNVISAGDKRATFVFDENIDPAGAYLSTNFGYYDATDTAVAAPAGPVSIDGTTATVGFGAAPGIEGAKRFFLNGGAVQDRPQTGALAGLPLATPSAPDVINKGAVSPSRPEMTAASTSGPQIVTITFNVPVSVATAVAAGFVAISDDGTITPGATSVGSGGSPNTITVTFPASIADDPSGIVRIFAAPGAIRNGDGSLINVAGTVPAATPNSVPGLTNGPDLLLVSVDTGTSRVTFKYDENVSETAPGPGALQGSGVDGSPINAIDGVVATSNTISARFPASVTSAVAFANPFATVFDRSGRVNPNQSVSKDIQLAPAVPPPPPPVAPPPPPPPPAVVPVVKKYYKTFVTIRRRGRTYSGALRSSRKSCIQKRSVRLKRNGISFGSARTNSNGRYTIRRSRRLRGRVYVTATVRSGRTVVCRSGKSRRIAG